jgi:hypothetical protein
MKRLLLRGLILVAPFLIIAAFVVVVDPYDYFGLTRVVSDRVKELTSGKLHYAMWKVHQFKQHPSSRILLGDSRMAGLSTQTIRAVTGEQYFNFAYGGGTPSEAIDTYWLASKITHLDAVYLEMGIINFNSYQNLNRVPEVISMDANPLMYLTNRLVVRAAFLASYVALTGDTVSVETPSMSPEDFWRFQVNEAVPQVLHQYAYPTVIAQRLDELADDCRRNGTRFVVVIPPTHTDVQQKVSASGRDADVARFKRFATSLGTVYDFDYPNALTADRSKFSDPFHVNNSDEIVREIWGSQHLYARRIPALDSVVTDQSTRITRESKPRKPTPDT